jgi:hypothetical protein
MKTLAIIVALLPALAFGQQAQTSAAPLMSSNVKYVQGVGPGYWPTPGTGLTLNVAAGTSFCSGTIVTYAGGTLTMTASTTNYVYLNSSCALTSNTTGFSASTIPIAKVVTGSSSITSVTDDRTMLILGGSGPGGGPVFCSPDAQTGSTYTLVLTDGTSSGSACIGTVTMNNASTNTVTVPPNSSAAFPVPSEIDFVQLGAGQTCLAAGAGVTLITPTSLCARAEDSTFGIRQLSANSWIVFGDTQ